MNGIKYEVCSVLGNYNYGVGTFDNLSCAMIFAEALIGKHHGEPTKVVIEQKLPEIDECKAER